MGPLKSWSPKLCCELKGFVVLTILRVGGVLFSLPEPLCVTAWGRHPALFPPQKWSLPSLSRGQELVVWGCQKQVMPAGVLDRFTARVYKTLFKGS